MEVGPDILREWIQAAISFVNKLGIVFKKLQK